MTARRTPACAAGASSPAWPARCCSWRRRVRGRLRRPPGHLPARGHQRPEDRRPELRLRPGRRRGAARLRRRRVRDVEVPGPQGRLPAASPRSSTATPAWRSCGPSPRRCSWRPWPCRPWSRSSTSSSGPRTPSRSPSSASSGGGSSTTPPSRTPTGCPIVTSGEMVIPADGNVQLSITSRDVIHSFWIPAAERQARRGAQPRAAAADQADEPGEYWGQCTEFCGLSHANMRMRVVALSQSRLGHGGWRTSCRTAAEPTDEVALRGKTTFVQQCARCHQVDGLTDADGEPLPSPNAAAQVVAGAVPNLTHLMSRTTFAGGYVRPEAARLHRTRPSTATGTPPAPPTSCLNRADLERWLRNAPAMKPMYVVPERRQGQIPGHARPRADRGPDRRARRLPVHPEVGS